MVQNVTKENAHCIRISKIYDWVTVHKNLKEKKLIDISKPSNKKIEDNLCINFKLKCGDSTPTTIWSGIKLKAAAATFTITHTCKNNCGMFIYVNEEKVVTISSGQTYNSTVAHLKSIAVQCVGENEIINYCNGKLTISLHFSG